MNKNNLIARIIIFSTLAITVLAGIYIKNVNTPLTLSKDCHLTNGECLFGDDDLVLTVEFMQAVVIEEEMTIRFTTAPSQIIDKAWIEGENMYMGKVPVILESRGYNDSTKIGVTFLGSCTQPKMLWRLYVQTRSTDTNQLSTYSVIFESNTQ